MQKNAKYLLLNSVNSIINITFVVEKEKKH